MHMRIDGAGQDMHARGVQRFGGWRHRRVVADGEYLAVLDGKAAVAHAIGIDERAVAQDDIGGDGHCRFLVDQSAAQPPSTGRSTPVIWREASLAMNKQALATSASIVTRRSA